MHIVQAWKLVILLLVSHLVWNFLIQTVPLSHSRITVAVHVLFPRLVYHNSSFGTHEFLVLSSLSIIDCSLLFINITHLVFVSTDAEEFTGLSVWIAYRAPVYLCSCSEICSISRVVIIHSHFNYVRNTDWASYHISDVLQTVKWCLNIRKHISVISEANSLLFYVNSLKDFFKTINK